ncbi:dCMP deaminase [Streptomyces sp. NPDC057565]|uniref:dCMP deaminase n=1 Tax=Streptomyces sp. NPDC057565 TaxID=3346169 RepID=UPI0036A22827
MAGFAYLVCEVHGTARSELAAGYSREAGPHEHAEEVTLDKLAAGDPHLAGATIYSTLEPCSQRRSPHTPCAQRILAAGVPRVVIAWRKPALFVDDCIGYEPLVKVGVTVVDKLAAAAKAVRDLCARHAPSCKEKCIV